MKSEFTGIIAEIGPVETFGSGFTKRTFVVDSGNQYPNPVPFQLTKDDVTKIDSFSVGERVTVAYFANGRKWEGPNGVKYFVDLKAQTITPAGGASRPSAGAPAAAPSVPVWKQTATKKDVFQAWQAKHKIDANGMVAQLNDRNSEFTKFRLAALPGKKWGELVDGSEDLAKLYNGIVGAQPPAAAPEASFESDPDDLPF